MPAPRQRKMRRKLNGYDCGLRYDKLLHVLCVSTDGPESSSSVCLIHWFEVISHDDVLPFPIQMSLTVQHRTPPQQCEWVLNVVMYGADMIQLYVQRIAQEDSIPKHIVSF